MSALPLKKKAMDKLQLYVRKCTAPFIHSMLYSFRQRKLTQCEV